MLFKNYFKNNIIFIKANLNKQYELTEAATRKFPK